MLKDSQRDIIYEQSHLKGIPIEKRIEMCESIVRTNSSESIPLINST